MFICSCSEQINKPETKLIADFNWEIKELDFYQVQFTNTSEGAVKFLWDFGNGETSIFESPTHKYAHGGYYDVTLTVEGPESSQDQRTHSIVIVDIPTPPTRLLSGTESKKWKLYRIGPAASLGPDSSQPDKFWPGFYNDGSRSCLYTHEFIFSADMTFEFNDHNSFWGDAQIWPSENSVHEVCFEPSTENMIVNGTNLSSWLSGTHSYKLDTDIRRIILRGKGAWMGFPFLGTKENHGINLPDSTAFAYAIEELPNYDLLTINFDHGQDGFWTFRYVSYDNWQDEPELVE